jgi:hypothetical protein
MFIIQSLKFPVYQAVNPDGVFICFLFNYLFYILIYGGTIPLKLEIKFVDIASVSDIAFKMVGFQRN